MMGVDIGAAHLDKIADLARGPKAEEVGAIGRFHCYGARPTRRADARHQHRNRVLVGLDIHLHPVESRLGKSHGRQRGADLFANGQGHVVLAAAVRGDDQPIEPRSKPRIFENGAAELLRLLLAPIVDEPSFGDERPIQVVEIIPLYIGTQITLVVVPGVIGVLPLFPAIEQEEFLRHVPAPHGRVQGVEEHARTHWFVRDLAAALQAQSVAIIESLGYGSFGHYCNTQQ